MPATPSDTRQAPLEAADTAWPDVVEKLQVQLAAAQKQRDELSRQLADAQHQLDWFRRQLFGQKSERQLAIDPAVQLSLLAGLVKDAPSLPPAETAVQVIHRHPKTHDGCVNDSGLRFDARVPVEVHEVPVPPGMAGEVIATHSTFKLAQRPAAYVVIEHRCPVLKTENEKVQTVPAPESVFGGSLADVSFLAGMLIDKFQFHLPLYRQHQRLAQAGIQISRATLTHLVARAAALLSPIHQAQLEHVLQSRVLAMDETPIKAGRKVAGKLHAAYFWPLYGEDDEVSFTFADTRAKAHIDAVLGDHFHGTLLTDGYSAYTQYAANKPDVTHAACWSHMRRTFERAKDSDTHVEEGLALIAALYHEEAKIREAALVGEAKQKARTQQEEPIVRAFWRWCEAQCQRPDLEPTHPLAKALHYATDRRGELTVFLGDPDVPLDTNHLERALRPIPMGRANWHFCWTEVGAEAVGIIQSLISTCRLHGVDTYTYLVDVLQRIQIHPARQVEQLTPRLWKPLFADRPLRSIIDRPVPSPAPTPPSKPPAEIAKLPDAGPPAEPVPA